MKQRMVTCQVLELDALTIGKIINVKYVAKSLALILQGVEIPEECREQVHQICDFCEELAETVCPTVAHPF